MDDGRNGSALGSFLIRTVRKPYGPDPLGGPGPSDDSGLSIDI